MLPVSDRWRWAAMSGGPSVVTSLTCLPPGGGSVDLELTACTVTRTLDSGARTTANVTVAPSADVDDLWSLVTAPGARFVIRHGLDYGRGEVEMLTMGTLRLAAAPSFTVGAIPLSLVDDWLAVTQAQFRSAADSVALLGGLLDSSTWTLDLGDAVAEVVRSSGLDPVIDRRVGSVRVPVTTWITSDGVTSWIERDKMVSDLCLTGGFGAYFAADGSLVIAPDSTINVDSPTWLFRDGDLSNLTAYPSRSKVFGKPYNAVTVSSSADPVAFAPVTVTLADPSHPNHVSMVGYEVPYHWASPLLASADSAATAAATILNRVIGSTGQTVGLSSWMLAALEPGDTVSDAISPGLLEPGRSGVWLVEKVEVDCMTLAGTVSGRSSNVVDTEVAS